MARTRSDSFHDIRASILDAAASLFASQGFRNTNIIQIGEACRASKSRMYHYFPSKEAMLGEMLLDHVSGLVTIAAEIVSGKGTPAERFRAYLYAHLKYYYDRHDRHRVLLMSTVDLPDDLRENLREKEHKLATCLEALLRELAPTRLKQKQVATAHAFLIYGMLNWTYTWYRPKGKLSLEALAEEASNLCLNGLG
jgi:AcrR family transcriptional regulator